jgi:hypothetical protein
VNPTASQSFCPRISEACHLLPLIRRYVVAAAPRPNATALELVPIVEDGLFGYELVSDRETQVCPIIGCNAQGEPILRKNSCGVGASDALRLVAADGRLLSRYGHATRPSIHCRDALFPSWLAAAESAWALLPLFPDSPPRTMDLGETAHRSLDKALLVAHSHLIRWDPFIEFFGIPNEVQLGIALRGARGEHGDLTLQPPNTWTLRWNAPPEAVRQSWSVQVKDLEAGNDSADSYPRTLDRRGRSRRATDRDWSSNPWAEGERRQGRGRREVDEHT